MGWIWVKGQEGGPVGLGLSIWRVTVPLAEMGDHGEKQVWGGGNQEFGFAGPLLTRGHARFARGQTDSWTDASRTQGRGQSRTQPVRTISSQKCRRTP